MLYLCVLQWLETRREVDWHLFEVEEDWSSFSPRSLSQPNLQVFLLVAWTTSSDRSSQVGTVLCKQKYLRMLVLGQSLKLFLELLLGFSKPEHMKY